MERGDHCGKEHPLRKSTSFLPGATESAPGLVITNLISQSIMILFFKSTFSNRKLVRIRKI
jgi:hypothetical protein